MTPSTKYPDDGRISMADQILDGRVVKTLVVDLKISPWKRRFLFGKPSFFRFHVKL